MSEIRLIIYAIFIIISIVSFISHKRKKSEITKKSDDVRKTLTPERTLNSEEYDLILKNYKYKGLIEENSPVYKIEGKYDFTEITYRGGSVKTHYIDCFEIHYVPQLEMLLNGHVNAEVVFTSNNVAFIINLNNEYSITDEGDILNELSKDSSTSVNVNKVITKLSRTMSDSELDFLNRDTRVFAAILMFVALLLPILSFNIVLLGISLLLFLISIFLYSKPISTKKRDVNRIIGISGKIVKDDITNIYRINRFKLNMPKHWNVQDGLEADIEGYSFDDKGSIVDVLKINSTHSIDQEALYSPIKKKSKFVLLIVFLSINLFLTITIGNGLTHIDYLVKTIPNLQLEKEFAGYNNILNTEFKEYQQVVFKNVSLMGYLQNDTISYGIIPDGKSYDLDFSQINSRIDLLLELQNTYYFIQLASLNIMNYEAGSLFIDEYGYDSEDFDPILFTSTFKNNDSYNYLLDVWNSFVDENYTPDIEEVLKTYNYFYQIEAGIIKDMIINTLDNSNYTDKIIDLGDETEYNFFDIEVYPSDLMLFIYNDYSDEILYNNDIFITYKLVNIKELLLNGGYKTDVEGVIQSQNRSDDKMYIDMDFSRDKGTMITSILNASMLLLTLFIMLFTIFYLQKKYKQ